MRQKTKLLLATASSLLFIGCGAGDTTDLLGGGKSGRDSSSTVEFDIASDKSRFTITLNGNIGDNTKHTNAEYKLFDTTNKTVLSANLMYNGKITTTCIQSAATTNTISYSCITKNDFTTVTGKPDDTTEEITLYIGKEYSLYKIDTYMVEKTISVDIDEKKTLINSFTL